LLGLLLLVGIGGVAAVAILRPAWLPFGLGGTGGTAQGPGEIFLEPAAAVGPDPFTPSVARQPVATTAPFSPSPTVSPVPTPSSVAPSATASAAIAVQTITGGSVGLYGGTKNNAECDMEQLVAYLEQNPDKAAAWASVHGIDPATIRQFVSTLTPVTLRQDTRVTNHGFRNGVAEARQSVLQAGTAVLVDDRGVPRARCFCGNPLLEPRPVQVSPTYTGDRWPEFAPEKVQVISPAPAPVAQLPIVDEATGDVFGRPPGTTGSADVAIVESSPSPVVPGSLEPSAAPSAPGPTALPGPGQGEPVARDPVFPSDLTALGAVQANSADPNFPIGLGVDMDATTSWFSIGPHSPSTVTEYVWAVNGPVEIGAVIVAGNAENANTSFRQGFGFSQLEIEVLLGGSVVSTATYSLDGTPDPNVLAPFGPGTVGDTVRLRLTGHESLDCGGIGELVVLAPGWEAELELLIEQGLGDLFAD
jgi:hypothetical protein